MSEMIERVARAIGGEVVWRWAGSPAASPTDLAKMDEHRRLARAAIEAMREPTEAMVEAAYRPYVDDDHDAPEYEKNTRCTWDGMVEAALSSTPVQD